MQTNPVPNYLYEGEQTVETELGKPVPIDPVRNRFQREHPKLFSQTPPFYSQDIPVYLQVFITIQVLALLLWYSPSFSLSA